MSLATKIAAGLCICPVVAAPTALLHKPTRDKIARAAGYVPKAAKPSSAPIAVNPQVACAEPSPSAPLATLGSGSPLALNSLPRLPGGGPFGETGPGGNPPIVPLTTDGTPPPPPPGPPGVIPGVPEPATWTVMVVGFGMVGAAMRRSNRPSTEPQPKGSAKGA